MNLIDTQDAIYDWLSAESGIPMYLAQQNMTEPTGQFGSYLVSVVDSVGHDEKQYVYHPDPTPMQDSMEEVIDGMRLVQVSINVYRGDSYDVMLKIAASLEKSYTTDSLWLSGLNFVGCSEIRNLTDLMHAEFESRHQLDVFFYVSSRYSSNVDIIETVNYQEAYH